MARPGSLMSGIFLRCRHSPCHMHMPQLHHTRTARPRIIIPRVSTYATNPPRAQDYPPETSDKVQESSYAQPAHKFSQTVGKDETEHYKTVEHSKKQQMRSPWTRADSDQPPVARLDSDGTKDMKKGKLLTTPSRMLKLILPLTTHESHHDAKDIEPLALLVHPQQPLSYLERLIQSELPPIQDKAGREKIPTVTFRAQDMGEDDQHDSDDRVEAGEEIMVDGKLERTGKAGEEMMVDGKLERTGKVRKDQSDHTNPPSTSPKEDRHARFVRWSPSTEIGDFIRDASKGKEFSVEIEGSSSSPIYVGVPTFADRTYYLRMRLRKTATRISALADLKTECDTIAHRSARRVAQAGFGVLVAWWLVVYRLTFTTELGWDTMEPVTYLVGLSTLIGGYMWFLYHNREVSYRSAMNVTISRRQSKLYSQRGFDLPLWETLMEEGNRLRREIRLVADEYDVEWSEEAEAGDEKVTEALREERKKNKKGKNTGDDDDDDDDDKVEKRND